MGKRSYEIPPLFVRVTETERKYIEAACKIQYGRVEGNLSEFVRRSVLLVSKQIIARHRKKGGGS